MSTTRETRCVHIYQDVFGKNITAWFLAHFPGCIEVCEHEELGLMPEGTVPRPNLRFP